MAPRCLRAPHPLFSVMATPEDTTGNDLVNLARSAWRRFEGAVGTAVQGTVDGVHAAGIEASRQVLYAELIARHPRIAWAAANPLNEDSLSNVAIRLANLDSPERLPQPGDPGADPASDVAHDPMVMTEPEVKALRHFTWQLVTASRYGEKLAEEMGNAHEGFEAADAETVVNKAREGLDLLGGKPVRIKGGAEGEDVASSTADLLNNDLARRYASENRRPLTPKEAAFWAVNYFKLFGLYVRTPQPDGSYLLQQRRLSAEKAEAYLGLLQKVDNNGWRPDQQNPWEPRQSSAKPDERLTASGAPSPAHERLAQLQEKPVEQRAGHQISRRPAFW